MTFEKDYKYLYFRIIFFAIIAFLFFFICSKIAIQSYGINFSIVSIIVCTIILNTIFNYFMIYKISREDDSINFKNIYNLSVKKIYVRDLVERKIFYHSVPSKTLIFFFTTGK